MPLKHRLRRKNLPQRQFRSKFRPNFTRKSFYSAKYLSATGFRRLLAYRWRLVRLKCLRSGEIFFLRRQNASKVPPKASEFGLRRVCSLKFCVFVPRRSVLSNFRKENWTLAPISEDKSRFSCLTPAENLIFDAWNFCAKRKVPQTTRVENF